MKKKTIVILCAVVGALAVAGAVLAAVLLSGDSGGGSKARASGMWLVGADGSVAVTDGDGGDVPVRARPGAELRLSLHSGYRVGTERESFGWLDLDDEKFAKLDELSEVQINKSGRKLEIEVNEGSLYFNVKKPLRDDETMEIRSSTMVMAIRGTSGWVTAADGETFDVYIIEGKVRCTAGDEEETVRAGEHARLTLRNDEGSITVEDFTREDIPEFVLSEAREDGDLREKLSDIGITVEPDDPDSPDGPDDPGGPGGDGGETALSGVSGNIHWEILTLRPESITHRVERLYYQIPVLTGPDAGLEAINRYFRKLAEGHFSVYTPSYDAYFDQNYDDERQLNDSYIDSYDARVDFPTKGILCVSVHHEDRNVQFALDDFPDTYYTFDLNTGERLKLSEVADGGVDGIRAAIREKLKDTPYAGAREDVLAVLPVDTLDFYVRDGMAVAVIHNHQVTLESDTEHVEVELPLGARWQTAGPGGEAPELDGFFTGEAVEPAADEASRLGAEMARLIADSVPSTDGSTVPTGRARLFLMDGNLAALLVCGKYDAGEDAFVYPVQTYLVYMSGGKANSQLIGDNRKSAWIYDGEVYVERSTSWDLYYINASGQMTVTDAPAAPDTEVGFRREDGAVICVGLIETDGLFAALESAAG